ncbi:MAG TPA: hypothetical protein VJI52_03520 [Candidatus Nanoarchaeia archaeon]|nr:hypothetical protein [Candidatus Nanoarchaeia archaeon]
MLKKGAIELSVNFLVIIIISIVVFGFGVYFISKLSATAADLTQMTTSELDQKIANLVCEGYDRVCIGTEKKVIQKKKFDVFGIKIFNVEANQYFTVTASSTKRIGPDKSVNSIGSGEIFINPENRPQVLISQNEEKSIGVGVQVNPSAQSGTYILDVKILRSGGSEYVPTQKLYVEVP